MSNHVADIIVIVASCVTIAAIGLNIRIQYLDHKDWVERGAADRAAKGRT